MITEETLADLARAGWYKSTHSVDTNCLEVATTTQHGVGLRDSKRNGPVLLFSRDAWQAFVHSVQNGEFDGGGTAA